MYLSIKSLIKFRLSQNRSQSRSRSRCPDAHLPSFPASLLVLFWRWGALSNGACLSNELSGVKERGMDHWPKKPYFCRFSASWHRKLWQWVRSNSCVKKISATRSLDSFFATMFTKAPLSYLQSAAYPWQVPSFTKARLITLKVRFGYVWMLYRFNRGSSFIPSHCYT